ncbi:MAG: CHASE2 domain-containing protein [Hydrococcus sp. Prado102]|jgi:CHASE2 domain-containing sensor protein|nr:CHASE2 domain-containing protein [Hydrococcus sp. Prado102]
MSQFALLRLEGGSLQQGFSNVTLQIGAENSRQQKQLIALLPAAPDLAELYRKWQFFYVALYSRLGRHLRITFPQSKLLPTNVSEAGFSDICAQLKARFNEWLDAKEFRPIERQLRTHFTPEQAIRVSIETSDLQLRQFPWHLWNFFDDFRRAEVALSTSRFEIARSHFTNSTGRVRILAVFGNPRGLALEPDLEALKRLPNANLKLLYEPSRRVLNDELWQSDWDIFFFAGHSTSLANGEISQLEISKTQSLSIGDLHYALRRAIERGLQLAIFNSCEGLGIVRELEKLNLHIPQTIVMREPVPDDVAQAFLAYFLESFARGEPLYLAVREARERLQGLENPSCSTTSQEEVFPCASWLPVICQNPTTVPPTWRELLAPTKPSPASVLSVGLSLLSTSAIATLLTIGLRLLGIFQAWELQAFDQLMRLRPDEGLDSRLSIVEATEEDVNRYGFPLPDAVLADAIAKIERHNPKIIGLDIFRPRPVEPGHREFFARLHQSDRLIALCSVSEADNPNKPGINPPPNLSSDRLGFSDVVVDPDGILRRHLLFVQPDKTDACTTDHSLSIRLAFRYLATQGIEPQMLARERIQLGKVRLSPLSTQMGAYQHLDDRGFQILLNYRASQSVARRIELSDLLSDKVDPNWIKNRVILIGVSAPISSDYFSTPYSLQKWPREQMAGVWIQAQMVSQILSAVLDGRPLLWVLPVWGEVLWIWGWSMVGGIIAIAFGKIGAWGAITISTMVFLPGICFVLLTYGGWVPLVPSALAFVATGVVAIAFPPAAKPIAYKTLLQRQHW